MGGNGRDSDGQVMTGPFAYGTGNWPITYGVTAEKYLTRSLGRPDRPIALPTGSELSGALTMRHVRHRAVELGAGHQGVPQQDRGLDGQPGEGRPTCTTGCTSGWAAT